MVDFEGGYAIIDLDGVNLISESGVVECTVAKAKELYYIISSTTGKKELLVKNLKVNGTIKQFICNVLYSSVSVVSGRSVATISMISGGSSRYLQYCNMQFSDNGTAVGLFNNMPNVPKFGTAESGKSLKVNSSGSALEWS